MPLWVHHQVQGPSAADSASDIVAVSRFATNMEAWWFGPNPGIRGAFWYDDGQGWRTYGVPSRLSNASSSGIAALSRIADSMELWWISPLGTVEGAFWYDDGKNWRAYQDPVAGPGAASTSSGIAAVTRIPESMEIWWVGIDGSVQGAFWYQTDPTWHRYPVTGFGAASTHGGVAAVSRFAKNMEIWWVGPQGSVEGAFWYDDGKHWRRYGQPVAPNGSAAQAHCIDAVSRTENSMDLLWISPSGAVRWAHWTDGSEWAVKPTPVAPNGSASAASGITVVKRGAGVMDALWVRPDGAVDGATWRAGTGWERYLAPVAGHGSAHTSAGITGLARTKSTTEVWWIAPDGSVHMAIRDDVSLPHSFRLLRPADLLDLNCTAIGCQLVGGAPTAPAVEHTVVRGETLWDIAKAHYGNPFLYTLIAAANNLADPDVIHPGDILIIPPKPAPAPPPQTYVVKSGDTLWDIAQRFYGNPNKYRLIAAANNLTNPHVITPGQKLAIPGVEPPPAGSRLIATEDDSHLIVHFGVQNIFEQATPSGQTAVNPAKSRAANDSRIVFELPKGTEIPYTVAGVLETMTTLGLRVPALAIPRVTDADRRPGDAQGEPVVPQDDQTAIEAPYRLIVSPNRKYGGFTHASDAEAAPKDPDRVGLWHTRLGVRTIDENGDFVEVDEKNDLLRTVRAVWHRDKPAPDETAPGFLGSLNADNRAAIVRLTSDSRRREPDPLDVRRLHLSALGAWIDWQGHWDNASPSAYIHQATMGRDQFVRVDYPVYWYPFGPRATVVKITERRIDPTAENPAANLFQRFFLVLREHTRDYTDIRVTGQSGVQDHPVLNAFPFRTITIDPVVSVDIDPPPNDPPVEPFVPTVGGKPYQWKVTGVDHEGRSVTMITPLVAVPIPDPDVPMNPPAHTKAHDTWINGVVKKHHPIDVGGAEIAFAPSTKPGDTTSRVQWIEFTGEAKEDTSTPELKWASIEIPALAALNRGGGPSEVTYRKPYVEQGFPAGDPAQLYLRLEQEAKLNFAGSSDRGGGFVEPSVSIQALSRRLGAVGDRGESGGDDITQGTFDPGKFLGSALPKLFGLFDLKTILLKAGLDDAPALITENQTAKYVWKAKITGWPADKPANERFFVPLDDDPRLPISVELGAGPDGAPQSIIDARLPNFKLQLPPGTEALMEVRFQHIAFRTLTGAKPEVDVQFDNLKFVGVLEFIERLRQAIPLDGFSDPPFVDITGESATAGFSLALPSVAIGVFSLENIALGADCRIPFLGEAVTVGFFFCTKEAPFRLTVLAIGGGGWVGIRLSPMGLVLLEMGLEAGASLSVDLGVASGSVSVMIGVYLRLEDKKGQLTGYFRIRGEVEVLGIASASITLELSLRYDFGTGKLIGRASLTVEIEVAFFSASVEITCERKLAGSRGDPSLKDIMPPDEGGQELWDTYYSAFAIGA